MRTLTILGLVVGILGLAIPIAWEQYKSAASLEVKMISAATVIEKAAVLDKIEIKYGGRTVDRVTQLAFKITNTGSSPIRSTDVVAPLTVTTRGAEVLDARVDGFEPAEVVATIESAEGNEAVIVRFPLLNPGDAVYVTVLVNGAIPDWSASARITGIRSISMTTANTESVAVARPLSWRFYLAAAGTGILILLSMLSLTNGGKERGVREMIRQEAFSLPTFDTREEYERFIETVIRPLKTKSDAVKILKVLDPLPVGTSLSETEKRVAGAAINSVIENVSASTGASVIFVALSCVGLAYLAYAAFW